jgi:multimeric flavodoxin WrbA
MVKILGISGSPRRRGNSELLLDRALEGASRAGAVVEKIVLNELCLKPCQGCGGCARTARCVIKDEMRSVYRKVDESDALVVASPVYFGSVSAQVKIMIDRFQPYWIKKYILKRPASKKDRKGIFLCVAGSDKRAFFANARSIIKIFFVTLNIGYFGGIFCGRCEGPGEIKRKGPVLKRSFEMGMKLAKSLS